MIAGLAVVAGLVGVVCLVAGWRMERREQDQSTENPQGR